MVISKQVCNWCGHEFTDKFNEAMNFSHQYGYGSKLDGVNMEFTLCPGCAVKFAGVLKAMFTYNPLDDSDDPVGC